MNAGSVRTHTCMSETRERVIETFQKEYRQTRDKCLELSDAIEAGDLDRAEELVEEIDRGYYDTPRRTTLVDLAEDLDMAKSTCSEILHRAEERVVKEYRNGGRDLPTDAAVTSD